MLFILNLQVFYTFGLKSLKNLTPMVKIYKFLQTKDYVDTFNFRSYIVTTLCLRCASGLGTKTTW